MFVYIHSQTAIAAPSHVVHVCPAAHLKDLGESEIPKEWFERDGTTPIQFPLVFQYGRCEVDSNMGRYLVENGIVQKEKPSRIIRASEHDLPHA